MRVHFELSYCILKSGSRISSASLVVRPLLRPTPVYYHSLAQTCCVGGLSAPLALVTEVKTQLGHSHLSAKPHYLPEHLFRWTKAERREATWIEAKTLPTLQVNSCYLTTVSDQALLNVADVSEKVADCCDLERWNEDINTSRSAHISR